MNTKAFTGYTVVSIVRNPKGVYASWTFWRSEVGERSVLVRELSEKRMNHSNLIVIDTEIEKANTCLNESLMMKTLLHTPP